MNEELTLDDVIEAVVIGLVVGFVLSFVFTPAIICIMPFMGCLYLSRGIVYRRVVTTRTIRTRRVDPRVFVDNIWERTSDGILAELTIKVVLSKPLNALDNQDLFKEKIGGLLAITIKKNTLESLRKVKAEQVDYEFISDCLKGQVASLKSVEFIDVRSVDEL